MKRILLAIIAVSLGSCAASLRVATDYDRNAHFADIKTFGIYRVSADTRTVSELNRNRIYNAIRRTMTERGYIESDRPDVWINAVAVVNTQRSVSSTTTATGFHRNNRWHGPHWRHGWHVGGPHRPYTWGTTVYHTQYHVNTIREGVLIIDIIDGESGHLIWQSVGNRRIDRRFRDNADDRINRYVREMLGNFPPR